MVPVAEVDATDAQARTPTLVAVCGLPGVGKTTVAERVAERVDGRLLRTDVVRKDLYPDPEYTEAESRRVYGELFDRARTTLQDGGSVVLDATFRRERDRERARSLAATTDAGFSLVRVECGEAGVRQRIAEREDDESDADFEVYATYRERFDPISVDHVTVDNSGTLEATYRQVDDRF
ncbi:kinase [halophilic archaeon]|nr:kinase [halophilic archaeon]